MHAVIIDDNEQNVDVLAKLLSRQKISSTRIVHPSQLNRTLETLDNVNVVFLDLEMPGVDGYSVLRKLKSQQRFSSTPVVAYSVHVSEMGNALEQGFDGFLGKPLNAAKFPEQIERILRGENVWETQ